ncbi:hypothetical protein ACQUFY_04625 [Robbsia andropogonis]|uniref:hypothetical protein n=1 Tax=Robbsia andropogonis TaxID=28092 RepID=UPI003D1D9BB9
MKALDLHPLCTLSPRMEGAEFDALSCDIAANGQREPIVVHDGMILDGGNRYLARVAAGVEPKTVPFAGGSIVAFVLSANLHRRNLSPGRRAAIVALAHIWEKSGANKLLTRSATYGQAAARALADLRLRDVGDAI